MPPKTSFPAAKLSLVLTHFQTSLTVHSFKDLEKTLPLAAGISSMQVKDYLQSLADESLIRVEKVGNVNWYWAFAGDEKKRREGILRDSNKEKTGLVRNVEQLKVKIGEEGKRLEEEEKEGGEGMGRGEMVSELEILGREKTSLKASLEGFGDEEVVMRRRGEVEKLKEEINKVTDNLWILINFVKESCGNDKETMKMIWNQFIGVEEEELENVE